MSFRLSEGKKKSSFGKLATVTTAIASQIPDAGQAQEKAKTPARKHGRNPSEDQHFVPYVRVPDDPYPKKAKTAKTDQRDKKSRDTVISKGRKNKLRRNNQCLHSNHY